MPEISHTHSYEQQNVKNTEAELTQEDRERLDHLFSEIDQNGLYGGSCDQETVALRLRLRDENGKAVRYVFEHLSGEETSRNSYERYKYICCLNFCTSGEDAEKVSELLTRDEINLSSDGSKRSEILKILQRIGTSENTDHLIRFASRCFDVQHFRGDRVLTASLQRNGNTDALVALYAILQRTDDRYERQRIELAIETIKNGITSHGMQPVGPFEEGELMGDAVERTRIRFNRLFEVEEARTNEPYDPYDYASDERNMSWEDEQDGDIEYEYRENEFAEIESRLETVKRLRHEIKKEQEIKEDPEDDDTKFLRRHWLEYREDNPSPYTPTLGIEIEIRDVSVLPKEMKSFDDKVSYLEEKKSKYKETRDLGVPAGNDKFWEFANAPTHYYATLSREVQALIEMGLINPQYPRHPLHVTIGGVTLGVSMEQLYDVGGILKHLEGAAERIMPEDGKETFVLARSLEATGYATTGGRLLRPYLAKGGRSAWAVKGVSGVKERDPEQIKLGIKEAVEFRTFQMQSFTGLDRLLRSAFLLGTALRAYQANAQHKQFEMGEDPDIRKQLTEIWKTFSNESRKIFSDYDIADPQTAWRTPSSDDNVETRARNSFKYFGDLLDDARQDPQGIGAEFVAKIRGLIITTRKQVADVVYQHTP